MSRLPEFLLVSPLELFRSPSLDLDSLQDLPVYNWVVGSQVGELVVPVGVLELADNLVDSPAMNKVIPVLLVVLELQNNWESPCLKD